MRILVTNDDGYTSPGLASLADVMKMFGSVDVVAPQNDKSGSSCSLTLDRPLRVGEADTGFFFVNGTPVDCVHLAISSLLPEKPDLIVSGINNGRNVAQDVHYSGTVSAAIEGHMYGIPSIAFSLDSHSFENLSTAIFVVENVVTALIKKSFDVTPLLNVNIPNVKLEDFAGYLSCKLGSRSSACPAEISYSPKGEKVYWIGASGNPIDFSRGTDFFALNNNFASITPLKMGFCDEKILAELDSWVEKSFLNVQR